MRNRTAALLVLSMAAATAGMHGQTAQPAAGYMTPPKAIVDIMTAEPLPAVAMSPNRDLIALATRSGMPPITEVAQPMLRVGGMRINPRNNGPHRGATGTGIVLKTIATGAERKVPVPANARIGTPKFSPDGKRIAFTNSRDTAIDLYIAEVATAQPRLVAGVAVNGLNNSCDWLDDSSALLCGFVPSGRGAPPAAPNVPAGPNIQESYGKPGPVRTYQDLLTSAHDEALFAYYMQSQLATVDAASGKVTSIGKPGMITSATPSPDGSFILVSRLKQPFSRLLPASQFPQDVEVWSRAGAMVRPVADVPMADTVPMNGVITGPRSYRWVPVEPATLLWVEALDKGDLKNEVPHRDRIMTIKAPFTGQPTEVAKTEYRYAGASWTEKGIVLLNEADRKTRTTRTWVLDNAWGNPRKLWDRKQQDQVPRTRARRSPARPVTRSSSSAIPSTSRAPGRRKRETGRSSTGSISRRSRSSASSAPMRRATRRSPASSATMRRKW